MSISGTGGGYLNTSNIMAWMDEHMSKLGDQVEDAQQGADQRLSQINDLNKIKSDIAAFQKNANPDAAKTLHEEIGKFLGDNQGAPNAADLQQLLGPSQAALGKFDITPVTVTVGQDPLGLPITYSTGNPSVGAACAAVAAASDGIQTQIDALGKQDQLDLVQIQSLVSNYNQAEQMGSNIIAGMSSTSSALINNIKA